MSRPDRSVPSVHIRTMIYTLSACLYSPGLSSLECYVLTYTTSHQLLELLRAAFGSGPAQLPVALPCPFFRIFLEPRKRDHLTLGIVAGRSRHVCAVECYGSRCVRNTMHCQVGKRVRVYVITLNRRAKTSSADVKLNVQRLLGLEGLAIVDVEESLSAAGVVERDEQVPGIAAALGRRVAGLLHWEDSAATNVDRYVTEWGGDGDVLPGS